VSGCRLADCLWALFGALFINLLLFTGIALLCHDKTPDRVTTLSDPIHLAAGRIPFPAEPEKPAMPSSAALTEMPQIMKKIPEAPVYEELEPPPEPAAEIEAPELECELEPNLLAAAKIPRPLDESTHKPVPTKRPANQPAIQPEPSTEQQPAAPSSAAAASGASAHGNAAAASAGSPGDFGSKEFGIGDVDKSPQIVRKENPAYPLSARRRNLTGKVTVKFLVDSNGKVRKPQILDAQPKGIFEQSVLDSISKWHFKPGIYQGREVATWVVLPIQFRLTGS